MYYRFYKIDEEDQIWRVSTMGRLKGPLLFSFDKKTIFNYWTDYPKKLTKEQKALFDKENPELAD